MEINHIFSPNILATFISADSLKLRFASKHSPTLFPISLRGYYDLNCTFSSRSQTQRGVLSSFPLRGIEKRGLMLKHERGRVNTPNLIHIPMNLFRLTEKKNEQPSHENSYILTTSSISILSPKRKHNWPFFYFVEEFFQFILIDQGSSLRELVVSYGEGGGCGQGRTFQ